MIALTRLRFLTTNRSLNSLITSKSLKLLYSVSRIYSVQDTDREAAAKKKMSQKGNNRLWDLLRKIADEENYENSDIKVTEIPSDGGNYTSKLFRATISDPRKDDLHLFAKVAAIGKKIRQNTLVRIYETEQYIYTEVGKAYSQIEARHAVPKEGTLKMPKYYDAITTPCEEIIVLEDLTSKGFRTHNRLTSVNWSYAAGAMVELAKSHALSMAFEREDPEDFQRVIDFLTVDWSAPPEVINNFWVRAAKLGMGAVRDENRDRLQKFLEGKNYKTFREMFEAMNHTVLIHSDFRTSNLMHRTRDDGSVEVVTVDFQTMQGGSPIIDLLYFIFTGTDGAFRAQYYDKLVDYYYTQLSACLTRLGMRPEKVYSKGDFKFELKEKLPFGLAVAVFTLPVVTVEAENAPKIEENMDLSSLAISKTGDLFPQRLNEVVDDFVRWGVL